MNTPNPDDAERERMGLRPLFVGPRMGIPEMIANRRAEGMKPEAIQDLYVMSAMEYNRYLEEVKHCGGEA